MLSRAIKEAISQLRAIEPSQSLQPITLVSLPTVRRSPRFFVVGLSALFGLAIIATFGVVVLPRQSVAGTVDSIRSAMEDQIRHERIYQLDGDVETLLLDRWTDGVRLRHDEWGIYSTISDGSLILRLNHQGRTAEIDALQADYRLSGFDVDAVLRDMARHQNLSDVEVKTELADGTEVIVARFSGKIADYAVYCDAKTRLPFSMIVDPTTPLHPEGRRTIYRYEYLETAGDLFSTSVPKGYTIIDKRK
jgi:hypothetical protein